MAKDRRATRDGNSAAAFHSKCDSQGATMTIIKTTKGNIMGGYATQGSIQ